MKHGMFASVVFFSIACSQSQKSTSLGDGASSPTPLQNQVERKEANETTGSPMDDKRSILTCFDELMSEFPKHTGGDLSSFGESMIYRSSKINGLWPRICEVVVFEESGVAFVFSGDVTSGNTPVVYGPIPIEDSRIVFLRRTLIFK